MRKLLDSIDLAPSARPRRPAGVRAGSATPVVGVGGIVVTFVRPTQEGAV